MVYFVPGIILVCSISFPSNETFSCCFFSGVTWVSGSGVFAFIFQISFFVIFFFNRWMMASDWLKKIIGFFAWFTGWSSYGYVSTIGTLRGSALVIVFDCSVLFVWVYSWFISWSFFWPTSLTGTLGGTTGGFAFLGVLVRAFGAYLCPCPNFTKGLADSGLCSA